MYIWMSVAVSITWEHRWKTAKSFKNKIPDFGSCFTAGIQNPGFYFYFETPFDSRT